MIKHVEKNNIFVLETKSFHYVLGIDGAGFNRHIHWGEKCDVNDYELFASYGIQTNSNPYGGRQRTPKSPQLLIILKLMC